MNKTRWTVYFIHNSVRMSLMGLVSKLICFYPQEAKLLTDESFQVVKHVPGRSLTSLTLEISYKDQIYLSAITRTVWCHTDTQCTQPTFAAVIQIRMKRRNPEGMHEGWWKEIDSLESSEIAGVHLEDSGTQKQRNRDRWHKWSELLEW